jgi:U11/U12 small nuclear ribonucleoprotein SNRNP65
VDINYPLNPNCKYLYPPINQIIIQNIVNALISNEKFYYQTLHLMNKMCLPCPFIQNMFTQQKTTTTVPMVIDSSSSVESEFESDVDVNLKKRPRSSSVQPKKLKMKKFLKNPVNKKKEQINVEEIFESSCIIKVERKKNGQLKKDDDNKYLEIVPASDGNFGKIVPVGKKQNEIQQQQVTVEDVESNESETGYITKEELVNNRLTESQLNELGVFKNYEKGEPNKRLYIKNLSKKVDESNLKHIYGRYVNFNNQNEIDLFDIRLMKEGRMKGQAFVTLPSEETANKALNETNGYMLIDKPIVVQFARSAKPKT